MTEYLKKNKKDKKGKKNKRRNDIMLNWNSGGNLTNVKTNRDYLRYGSITNTAENSTKIIIPKSGTLSNLVVKLVTSDNENAAPGVGLIRNFTIRKNGEDTGLIVSVSDDQTYGSSNVKIDVKKFDLISLVHTVNANQSVSAIGIASVLLN